MLIVFVCVFSAFVTKLLLKEDVSDDKSTKSDDEEVAADVCDKDNREIFQRSNSLATDLNKTGE